ncbi:MAG: 7TM diverse intracellular signaling domain-containing protein [Bacteroidota bacterium]|nr:7TM diverse intracellular signaling domain-containing protein [Bacteroidota bacterium]
MLKNLLTFFTILLLSDVSYGLLVVKEALIFSDSSGSMTLNEALKQNFDSISPAAYLNCTQCNYWIRFKIENKNKNKEGNMLITNVVKEGQLFYLCPDERIYISTEKVGSGLPTPEYNTYMYPFLPFKISDSSNYYYFKFKVIKGKMINPYSTGFASIADTNYLMNYSTRQYIYLSVILAILFLVALFTLIVFIKIKEKMYFWYFCYLFFAFIFVTTIYNIPFRYLYHLNFNLWDFYNSYALFFTLMTVSLLFYTQAFLGLKNLSKFLYLLLTSMAIIKIICYSLGVAFNEHLTELTGTNTFFHNPRIDFVCLIPAYLSGIYALYKGDKFALYFVGAFSIIIAGFLLHSFGLTLQYSFIKETSTGFVSNSFFDLIVIEVILFTFALAERFRVSKQEKEEALQQSILQLHENAILREKINQELELKVKERTAQIEKQNEEISRMNELLKKNNIKLEEDVKDLSKARVTLKPVTFEEFKLTYPNEDACLNYLVDLKWGNGFACRKCKNKTYIDGKTKLSRRCNACWYEETPTVGTIFHKLKFPIEKAFYLLFLVTNNSKISIEELAKELSISERTCWSYKNKILEAKENSKSKKKSNNSWDSIIMNKNISFDD